MGRYALLVALADNHRYTSQSLNEASGRQVRVNISDRAITIDQVTGFEDMSFPFNAQALVEQSRPDGELGLRR